MQLALVIWFINFATTAEYYTIGDFIFSTLLPIQGGLLIGLLLYWIFILDGPSFCKTPEEQKEDRGVLVAKYKAFWSSNILKGIAITLFVISIFGTILDSLIPKDNNTIYLMIGAYVTSQALETCTSDKESLCYKLSDSLEKKITKAVNEFDAEESLDKAADKVTEKVIETATADKVK